MKKVLVSVGAFLIALSLIPLTIFLLNLTSESKINIASSEIITDKRTSVDSGIGSFKIDGEVDIISKTDGVLYKTTNKNDYVMVADLNELNLELDDISNLKSRIFGISDDTNSKILGYIAFLYNNGFYVERASIGANNGFLISEQDRFENDLIKKTIVANGLDNNTDMRSVYYITYEGKMIAVLSKNEDRQLSIISSYGDD